VICVLGLCALGGVFIAVRFFKKSRKGQESQQTEQQVRELIALQEIDSSVRVPSRLLFTDETMHVYEEIK